MPGDESYISNDSRAGDVVTLEPLIFVLCLTLGSEDVKVLRSTLLRKSSDEYRVYRTWQTRQTSRRWKSRQGSRLPYVHVHRCGVSSVHGATPSTSRSVEPVLKPESANLRAREHSRIFFIFDCSRPGVRIGRCLMSASLLRHEHLP